MLTADEVGTYEAAAGPFEVGTAGAVWHDAERARDVPMRAYWPAREQCTGGQASSGTRGPATSGAPLVVFSPGLGAGCDDYAYLGRHWASYGFVCVHVTHVGTDAALWQGNPRPWPAMCEALDDPRNRVDRPRDLSFAIDQLGRDAELAPRIDFTRIAAAGHSFGAFTAMVLAGLKFDMPDEPGVTLRDARVGAVVAMSPQGPGMFGLRDDSWDEIDVPLITLTGTRDRGLRSKKVEERFVAFERIAAKDQYLVVFNRANHYAFGDGDGIGLKTAPREPQHHGQIQMASSAFLDGYLRERMIGRRWLAEGGLLAVTEGDCRVETRDVTLSSSVGPV